MPTGIDVSPLRHARNFALRGVAWSVALFGALRLQEVEAYALLPVTQLQGRVAERVFGAPSLPIEVTLACSGADAIALCAGFILAYPAGWRSRIAAAAGGIGLIIALNTLRIGTLGLASSPIWFEALHVYIWPALLMLAIAGYVFAWMQTAGAMPALAVRSTAPALSASTAPRAAPGLSRRFVLLSLLFVALFTAAAPWYLASAGVLGLAELMTRAAAHTLRTAGIEATAAGNILWTTRGGFLVTQECIATPLIPVYAAAVLAYAGTRRRIACLLLAGIPAFVALGIVRLLVVALPPTLTGSPLTLVHAFYQLVFGAVIVGLAAAWRHGPGPAAWRRGALALSVGCGCVYAVGAAMAALLPPALLPADPQGAIALLPGFQVGLYAALCVSAFLPVPWRLFAAGLVLLGASQVAAFSALHLLQPHFAPHVRDVRAWAVAIPVLLVMAMVTYGRSRR